MKAIVKVLVPVSLVFATVGAQAAGTMETDYPMNVMSAASIASSPAPSPQPRLIQSNHEGVIETAQSARESAATTDRRPDPGTLSLPEYEKRAAALGYFA
jgi:hypothetical protein